MQVPEHLRNYIDYEAYGRDIALEESGQFTDMGYVRDMLALVDSADKAPIRLIGLGMILLDEIVQTSKTKITTGNKHLRDFYLKEALSYIERNFQRNVSIEKIADASGLNRSYFSRLFKETFGQPPPAVSHPIPPDQSRRASEEHSDFRGGSRTFCGIRQPASFLPCIQKRLWGPTQ